MENDILKVLEGLRINRKRVRIFSNYGKVCSNVVSVEENDVIGSIGRSTGRDRIYLLLSNSRSMGGGGLMPDCIIGIKESGKGGKFLYKRYDDLKFPTYEVVPSTEDGYTHALMVNGELYSNHKTMGQAVGLGRFLCGMSDGKTSKES